jgi:hypothetical protein
MHTLIQLRRVPTLSLDYEAKWASLKNRASELIDNISKKCIRTQAATVRRLLMNLQQVEPARGPVLCLANEPFYPESEYTWREEKVFKTLKKKLTE